jgi:mono/diheme cytochrome c family protein
MIAFPLSKKIEIAQGLTAVRWAAVTAIAALIFLAFPGARAQSKPQPNEKSDAAPSGNKENGKKLYMSDGCYACHGTEGQGATQATGGTRIGPPQISFEAFSNYLHHPTGQMPPYTSKVISDQELADIYAFLESKPNAKPGKDIPLLNQ